MSITTDNKGNIYFCPKAAGLWKVNLNEMIPEQKCCRSVSNILHDGNHTIYFLEYNNVKKLDFKEFKELFVTRQEDDIWPYIPSDHQYNCRFQSMQNFAMDSNGNLYVTDKSHVRKVSLNPSSTVNLPGYQIIRSPGGIAVDKDGIIYVTDQQRHCIWEIKNDTFSILAGITDAQGCKDDYCGTSLFDTPREMALDIDGTLLVLDNNGFRRIDKRKNIVWTETGLKTPDPPVAFTIDNQGNVFVQTRWSIIRFENVWKWERFLWIGNRKEQVDYCHLAKLPTELIREIASWLTTRFQQPTKPKLLDENEAYLWEYERL